MPPPRVFSIVPAAGRFGYCYFRGTELFDWGAIRAATGPDARKASVSHLLRVFSRYQADVVIVPAFRKADRRRHRQRTLIEAFRAELGSALPVTECAPRDVKECFRNLIPEGRLTNQRIMAQVGRMLPELAAIVPKPRKPWHSQRYWTATFSAAAQAITLITNIR